MSRVLWFTVYILFEGVMSMIERQLFFVVVSLTTVYFRHPNRIDIQSVVCHWRHLHVICFDFVNTEVVGFLELAEFHLCIITDASLVSFLLWYCDR